MYAESYLCDPHLNPSFKYVWTDDQVKKVLWAADRNDPKGCRSIAFKDVESVVKGVSHGSHRRTGRDKVSFAFLAFDVLFMLAKD